MSLRLLLRALNRACDDFSASVLLPEGASPQLIDLYEGEGAEVSSGLGGVVDGSVAAYRVRDRGKARANRFWKRQAGGLRPLESSVRQAEFEVVHLNSSTLAPEAEWLLEEGIPFVWHVREPPNPRGGSMTAWIADIMSQAPAVVFLSEYDRRSWMSDTKSRGRTFVVPNAVDVSLFRADPKIRYDVRRRLEISPDAPVVLYAGGLVEIKGARQLLTACTHVSRVRGGVRFLMPGAMYVPAGGPLAGWVRRALALAGHRTFGDEMRALLRDCGPTCLALPHTPDIHSLFAAADVVAFPSLVPHFARPIIEAMAVGCSVVASDLGGVRELAQSFPDEMVTMVPAGNVDALARALVDRLASDTDEFSREQARRRAREGYGLERHGTTILDIYKQVLQLG